jgi:uncharacterized membrane protein YcaP (DUF421 family)
MTTSHRRWPSAAYQELPMFEEWFAVSLTDLVAILLSALVVYAAVLIYTRIIGLRSFSKMSAADFAMTIACGSILGATIAAPTPTAMAGSFALLCLFIAQWSIAIARQKFDWFSKVVDNQPILLMAGPIILDENLKRANITRDDLYGKLREANAFNFDDVKAVIFESTGDVSVLHSDDKKKLEPKMFGNVIDSDRLFVNE